MREHHRNMAFRPPRRTKDEDEGGNFVLYRRFVGRYLWPHRSKVAICAIMLSVNACNPYLMSYYGRVIVDNILMVGDAAAPAKAPASLSVTARDRAAGARATTAREPIGRGPTERGARIPAGAMPRLMAMFTIYIGTIFGLNFLSRLLQRTRIAIGQQITGNLREDMHEKVLELSLSYHKAHAPGRLLARILSDVSVVQDQMMATILDVTSSVVMLAVGVAILFSIEWRMGLIALSVLPPYVFLHRRSRMRLRELNRELRHTNSCMYGLVSQKLEGIRTIQAYNRENHERLNFHRLSACFLRDSVDQQIVGAGLGRAAAIVASFGTGLVFLYGTRQVLDGHMTLGRMMFAYGAAANLFGPVLALNQVSLTASKLLVTLQRLVRVLDEPVEIVDAPDAVDFPAPMRKGITLQHLNFNYSPSSPPVVEDVLMRIPAGQWLCIMGPSGSGKTTLLYLLARLYQPQWGQVLYDDVPVDKIRVMSLRHSMALVPQEPQIFSGTIRDNICYGFPDAQPSQIVAAAQAAELHDFIMTLPVKYETIIGERGTTLSGGQRQRLSLARAMLNNPEVLLLDDCTSALDAETEQKIQATLMRVLKGKTAVIVSQRVSMAQRCHRICTLQDGLVAETGTHAELVAHRGFYARLYAQQTGQPMA